ncbi:hypothetical protein GCM10010432_49710 [Catellatospora methionotrophica]
MLAGIAVQALAPSVPAQAEPSARGTANPTTTAILDARKAAKQTGKSVQIPALTTETTRVWAEPDGTETAEIHTGPVRLKRDGKWLDYDFTLVRRPDGTVGPKAHPHDLVIAGAKTAGEHDLATLNAHGEKLGFGWTGALPEPVLDGSKATYPEVAPGIDLVIEARTTGFEQFYIVKDRTAATRVATLRTPLRTGGTTFAGKADGSGEFRKADGKIAARMPVALMWDNQGLDGRGDRKRQAKVNVDVTDVRRGTDVAGRDMRLRPDTTWLNDPATKYPVVVDPGIDVDVTVGFDEFVQNTIDIDDNSTKDELKIGYTNDGCSCQARSYLRFDSLGAYRGAKINSAMLNLWETHSHNCTATKWLAKRTAHVTSSVQWRNEPAALEPAGDSSDAKGWSSSCAAGWVDVDVAAALDDTFNSPTATSASIMIQSENWNLGSWKKFDSYEGTRRPHIKLNYNRLPTISQVKVDKDPTCRSGAGVRLLLKTPTPAFEAFIVDVDKQNVRLQVEITPFGGTAWPLIESTIGSAGNGDTQTAYASRVELPQAQALQANTVYSYRVRAVDLTPSGAPIDYSAWSPSCEIQYDTTALDGVPLIEGIPVVDVGGEQYNLLKFGRSNVLTLRPDPADLGDVVRYSYGFDQARVGESSAGIAAGGDGTATVSVVPWEVDGYNAPVGESTLYVRAFAANGSFRTSSVQIFFDPAYPMPDPVPHVRDDVDGDGVPDLSGFRDLGNGKGMFYTYPVQPGGALLEPVALMTTESYTDANSDTVRGDFDGDGKTDFAVFKSVGATSTTVSLLRSTGNVPYADALSDIQVKALALSLSAMRVMAADMNSDGKDDLVMAYANGTASWTVKVLTASVDDHGTTTPHDDEVLFSEPVDWRTTPIAADLSKSKVLVARGFSGGSGVTVVEYRQIGTCQTAMYTHGPSSSTNWHQSPATPLPWCLDKLQLTTGNYDGDGDTDVIAGYDMGGCRLTIDTFTPKTVIMQPSGVPAFTIARDQRFDSGIGNGQYWCAPWVELAARDLTADGKDDLLLTYKCCGLYQQRIWQFTADGSGFGAPALKWQGMLGAAGTGSLKHDGTTHYQLVAKQSGMCLSLNGGSYDGVPLVQQPCARNLLDQRFVLEQRGAGHIRLQPQHIPSRCLVYDVIGAGNPVLQKLCTTGVSQESFQAEYVSGTTNDPQDPQPTDVAVRLLSNGTGSRCVGIQGASVNAGAAAVQDICQSPGYPAQSYYLRALAPLQATVRASWAMNEAGGTTLADGTGNGATAKIAGGGVVGGGALTLNGTSQFASLTGPPLYTHWGSYTVSAWVKLDTGARWQNIVAQEGSLNSAFYLRQNANGKWNFTVLSNPNSGTYTAYVASSAQVAQVGVWTHLVGVHDEATHETRLYVDGVLAGTATGSSSGTSGPLIIGASKVSGARSEYLDGQIDDVSVWNHALTAAEISQLPATRA